MPTFDIVSEVNSMEIENAVNIAKKELANRFDFKGTNAEIVLEKNEVKLSADDLADKLTMSGSKVEAVDKKSGEAVIE